MSALLAESTELVRSTIRILYADKYPIVIGFLLDLNGWIKSENNSSPFIKSITDPRFIKEDNQHLEYIKELQQEFAAKIAEDVVRWLDEKLPSDFPSVKYPLLREKYCLDSQCVQQKPSV